MVVRDDRTRKHRILNGMFQHRRNSKVPPQTPVAVEVEGERNDEESNQDSEQSNMDPLDVYIQKGSHIFMQVEAHPGTVAWKQAIREATWKFKRTPFGDDHFTYIMEILVGDDRDFYVGSLEYGWNKLKSLQIKAKCEEAYNKQIETDDEINSLYSDIIRKNSQASNQGDNVRQEPPSADRGTLDNHIKKEIRVATATEHKTSKDDKLVSATTENSPKISERLSGTTRMTETDEVEVMTTKQHGFFFVKRIERKSSRLTDTTHSLSKLRKLWYKKPGVQPSVQDSDQKTENRSYKLKFNDGQHRWVMPSSLSTISGPPQTSQSDVIGRESPSQGRSMYRTKIYRVFSKSSGKKKRPIEIVSVRKSLDEDINSGMDQKLKNQELNNQNVTTDAEAERSISENRIGRSWWKKKNKTTSSKGMTSRLRVPSSWSSWSSRSASFSEPTPVIRQATSIINGGGDTPSIMGRILYADSGSVKEDENRATSPDYLSSPSSFVSEHVSNLDGVAILEAEGESRKDIESTKETLDREVRDEAVVDDDFIQEELRLLDVLVEGSDIAHAEENKNVSKENILSGTVDLEKVPSASPIADTNVVEDDVALTEAISRVISQKVSQDESKVDSSDDLNTNVENKSPPPMNKWTWFPMKDWALTKVGSTCGGGVSTTGVFCGMNGCEDIEQAIVEEHGSCCISDDQLLPLSPYRDELDSPTGNSSLVENRE